MPDNDIEFTFLSVESLRRLFDLAVDSPLLCSGSFESDDVDLLRRIARLLGIDPETITPDEFITQYPHAFKPKGVFLGRATTWDDSVVTHRRRGGAREETDAEMNARIERDSADKACTAGTLGRRCGLLVDDPKHVVAGAG